MKFEIYRTRERVLPRPNWRWRITARNGRIVGASSPKRCDRVGARRNAKRLALDLGEAMGFLL